MKERTVEMKRRILSIIMSVAMVLAFMPAMAFAEDAHEGYVQIALTDCTKIGRDVDKDADIYYYNLGDNGTKVQFSDLAMEEDGAFSAILGHGGMLSGTNAVDLEDISLGLGLSYQEFQNGYGKYLDEEACEGLDFSNIYGVFAMDDDYESYYFIIQGTSYSFSFDNGQLTGMDEKAVAYDDYSDYPNVTTGYMDQYHVAVPTGIDRVELSFTEDRICYAYDKDGRYEPARYPCRPFPP